MGIPCCLYCTQFCINCTPLGHPKQPRICLNCINHFLLLNSGECSGLHLPGLHINYYILDGSSFKGGVLTNNHNSGNYLVDLPFLYLPVLFSQHQLYQRTRLHLLQRALNRMRLKCVNNSRHCTSNCSLWNDIVCALPLPSA